MKNVLKVMLYVSIICLIIGITLLVANGFNIERIIYVRTGQTADFMNYTQIFYSKRLNIEGIVFSSIGVGLLFVWGLIKGLKND